MPQCRRARSATAARYLAWLLSFEPSRLSRSPRPEGLRFSSIHHIGELEKSSKRLAPRSRAFWSIVRCVASADQFQLPEAGSSLAQSAQKPSICLYFGTRGDSAMQDPPWQRQELPPALYRTMLKPRPGRSTPDTLTFFVVKKRSARSSRRPKALAHHVRDTPQPSQMPHCTAGSTAVLWFRGWASAKLARPLGDSAATASPRSATGSAAAWRAMA
mmetsp:Transcript_30012/g.81353  ORF Transcript_30012/g.81353 Transcript_30012/m.81353 type:complete len:216 (+) Transcript_30012:974-1621(+)